jgi:predicted glycogen debranching enzyme
MPKEPITFGSEVCANLELALDCEWLETNGLGGFASSTVAGINTRRYHGLLTAATKPPVGRLVLLSKYEETAIVGDRRYDLSANRYPGTVHPQGYTRLTEFRLDPVPTWVWDLDGVELRKRIFMVHGENTVVVEYETIADCSLELRPLIAFRDYHSLTHRNDTLDGRYVDAPGGVAIRPYRDLPELFFSHNGARIERSAGWYFNFEYDRERERGLDCQEDLFNPFVAHFQLTAGAGATMIASTAPHDVTQVPELRRTELRRREGVLAASPSDDPLVMQLVAAADQFVAARGDLETIIAGYHWFSDWGRDTMIALPGIALVTGRFETAKRILRAFAASADRGMLPNRFPDAGEAPEYNTVDATLWFFEAVRAYLAYSGDEQFVLEELYPTLRDIIQWHLCGTRYGIHADDDGLLACGEPGVQLTWMDAKIGDWVVTPRHGKPVEIQALWYNALCIQRDLAGRLGDAPRQLFLGELAAVARKSFNRRFWNSEAGCLFDVVNDDGRDGSIRPNQILAISLHYPILDDHRAPSVVHVVKRELLTPVGLRSLSPRDPAYRTRYEGGVISRDSAYHQGTVWPWLMGPFITAYMKVHAGDESARRDCEQWLRGFTDHLLTAGLGHISEVADGEAPHRPGACIAQAWSVAEPLRAAVEDVFASRRNTARAAAAQAE